MGRKGIDRLARDLKAAFPEVQGFSPRNLVYMQTLARAYPDEEFAQQVVARLPWGHDTMLFDKFGDPVAREWYLRADHEHGWSRSVLVLQIEARR